MSAKIGECCECRYWVSLAESDDEVDDVGECHRHAPSPKSSPQDDQFWWPRTNSFEWCGEWQPNPADDYEPDA
jgi:hypothetical protein